MSFFRRLWVNKVLIPTCRAVMHLTKPAKATTYYPETGTSTVVVSTDTSLKARFLGASSQTRLGIVLGTASLLYVGGIVALSYMWYRHQRRSTFHFFNDNDEWQQMDKFGHAYTAFHVSRLLDTALRAAQIPPDTALRYSGWAGAIALTPIEILDGFSDGYGASWGDEVANIAGSAFFIWQQRRWGEIRLHPRFAFRPTHYAAQRPSLLGKSIAEQWLKDYNGQSYWLAADAKLWRKVPLLRRLPAWCDVLQPAVGYAATDMLYGRPEQNRAAGLAPYRKFYIAIDTDLSRRRIGHTVPLLRAAITGLQMLSLPKPVLAFDERKGFYIAFV